MSDVRMARPREWRAYLEARTNALAAFNRGERSKAMEWQEESIRRHGRWRGYDPDARLTFGISVDLPWAEADLLVGGISDERRVRAEFEFEGIGLTDAGRLLAITLNDDLSWPLFDEWRTWFGARDQYPASWPGELVDPEPMATTEDQAFRSLCAGLPEEHVVALTLDRSLVEVDLLCERLVVTYEDGLRVIEDLVRAGLATHPGPMRARLHASLTVADLRRLAARYGIKATGTKDRVLDALLAGVPEGALESVSTPDYVELRGAPASAWMAYRIAFVNLWRMTVWQIAYREREFRQLRDAGAGLTYTTGECGICSPLRERRVAPSDLTIEAMPPFHPGCTCVVIPDMSSLPTSSR